MLRRCITLLSLLALPGALTAQVQPHITFRLEVNLSAGSLGSRACLTRLPAHRRYAFILHRGLNIKSIRNGAGRLLRYQGYENGRFVGEGVVYTVMDSVAATDSLCIEYGGAYPVYAVDRQDFSTQDYKGFIAFNGRTVRAAEQSKWYPILYDAARGARAYEAVTYDGTVRCPDCKAIYVNGDEPRAGPEAQFRSPRAVALLLFAGDFDTKRQGGLTLLNATRYQVAPRSLERLAAVVDSIRAYYERWLSVPYGQPLVFLQHTITEDNARRRWGFVTYPTIAFSNDGFAGFVNDTTGAIAPFVWPYLGHEMAHYYFGTLIPGQGPYYWFLIESLAEYLGLQTLRQFQGDSAFRARIGPYARRALADTTSVSFDRITSADQLHDRYRYEYAPLLLVALEESIGAQAMRTLLGALLGEPGRAWDYAQLRAAALAAGVPAAAWQEFEERCVRPSFARGCLAKYAQ
jgi:hypothetical protein